MCVLGASLDNSIAGYFQNCCTDSRSSTCRARPPARQHPAVAQPAPEHAVEVLVTLDWVLTGWVQADGASSTQHGTAHCEARRVLLYMWCEER